MDIICNILRGMEIKGPVPAVTVEVDLHGIRGLDGMELIIKDDVILG